MSLAFAMTAKLAVVGGLVAVGVGAAAIAPTVPVASAAPGVWIDAPAVDTLLPIGQVTVEAHSTGTSNASAELAVDGQFVRNASTTAQTGTLTLVTFDWTATAGSHQLVVSVGSVSSAPRTVLVFAVAEPTTTAPVITPKPPKPPTPSKSSSSQPTTTPSATSSNATSSNATSSTSTPTSPHTTPTSQAATSSSPRTSPPTSPSRSSTPPQAPTVSTPKASNHLSWCDGSATITVTTTGATAVSIQVSPGGPKLTATGSGGSWSVLVNTAELPQGDFDQRGEYSLIATATGPGGTVTSATGTLTMDNCKP
jgi:flagellar hook-length control protein FliK